MIATSDVRRAAVAGTWYPASAEQLGREVDGYVDDAGVEPSAPPLAIVAPHAGLKYSGPVAAFAYKAARQGQYRAAMLVGPSHFLGFEGVSIWPRGSWQTPLGLVRVAEDVAETVLRASNVVVEHRPAHAREHSLEMQLPFLARLLPGVPIVPMVMGRQDRKTAFALGTAIESAGRGVLLIASSDLSHFHDADTAALMDTIVLEQVATLDAEGLMQALEREPQHACGGGPMVAVLHAARRLGATSARILKYGDSGDVTGDKSSVVGYMSAAVW